MLGESGGWREMGDEEGGEGAGESGVVVPGGVVVGSGGVFAGEGGFVVVGGGGVVVDDCVVQGVVEVWL